MDAVIWTIEEILAATGGEQVGGTGSVSFAGVSIDSRNIQKNELFVAVKGESHDGHRFIGEVAEKGVRGIVVAREWANRLPVLSQNVCCIVVPDSIRALGDLAAFHRQRFQIPVVAITGSNGKTTTKEMTASVLGQKYATLKTLGNLNNEFGVPLTLFRLNGSHEAAVLELGMNHPGEIRRLSEICRPDFGIITNIGEAHLAGLGTVDAVMAAKGELLENIKDDGVIVLNGDDPHSLRLGGTARRKVCYFGRSVYADVRAIDITGKGNHTAFTLELPDDKINVEIKAPGQFMVQNALAASAIGYLNGLTAREIKSGLEAFRPVPGRMDIRQSGRGFFIIDDTYNANPGSMEAAIKTLISLKGENQGVLVAGDMLELGNDSEPLHERIGRLAARSGVNRLFLTGMYADAVRNGARQEGMPDQRIMIGAKTELVASLIECLVPEDWVLVKGSRGSKMEEVVSGLAAE